MGNIRRVFSDQVFYYPDLKNALCCFSGEKRSLPISHRCPPKARLRIFSNDVIHHHGITLLKMIPAIRGVNKKTHKQDSEEKRCERLFFDYVRHAAHFDRVESNWETARVFRNA